MAFWDDIKTRLQGRTASCGMVDDLVKKFKQMGIDGLLVARSAHHLASLSTLTAEYVEFTERLLLDGDRNRMAALVACTRETGVRIMRLVDDMGLGFEQLIGAVEMSPEISEQEEDEEADPGNEVDREELTAPTSTIRQALESKLGESGVSHRLAHSLARSMADMYAECILFNRMLDRLMGIEAEEYDDLLAVLLDLQYGFDEQMRQALSDVLGSDENLGCTVGMLSYSAQFLAEMEVAGLRFQVPATTP